jgi:hypothetical protein
VKSLFLRQLRLLAPSALASVALGLLTLIGSTLFMDDAWRALNLDAAGMAFMLVGVVAPWLLGVASIAPDAESGGLAFLGVMPLKPGRHLALRVAAAGAWTAVAVLPFAAGFVLGGAVPDAERRLAFAAAVLLATIPIGAAGLAAAATAGRSLAAFIVTPALLFAPLGAYVFHAQVLGAPSEFFVGGFVALPIALLLATWASFRELRHPGLRPALRGVGALLLAVALGCGVTTTAYGWARLSPAVWVEGAWISDQGPMTLTISNRSDWPRSHEWQRVAVVPRERLREGADLLAIAQSGLVLEGGDGPIAFGPDGATFVQQGATVALLDAQGAPIGGWGYAPQGLPWSGVQLSRGASNWNRLPVGWTADGVPWVLSLDGRSGQGLDGRPVWSLPDGTSLEALGLTMAIVRDDAGRRWSLDTRGGAPEPIETTPDTVGVDPSPTGRWLVVGRRSLEGTRRPALLEVRSRSGDVAISLPVQGRLQARLTFSPDESTVILMTDAIDHAQYVVWLSVVELERGEVRTTTISNPPSAPSVRAWSPSGRRLLLDIGWLDLDEPALAVHPLGGPTHSVGHFPDDISLILLGPERRLVRVPLTR